MIKLLLCFTVYSLAAFISIVVLHAQDISLDLGGGVKMEFVWIPLPGGEGTATVQIGDFTGAHSMEPVKEVAINGPFTEDGHKFGYYLGKTEVTEAQWAAVMGSGKKSKFPATEKSYAEILAFIDALHSKGVNSVPKTPDGKSGEIRLPTEAEWEYAARGGVSAVNFQASDPYQGDIEKHEVFASPGSRGLAREVATFPPNSLGLYDMLGNVREFVEGLYLEESGGGRLVKGGFYVSEKSEIRSSARTEQSSKAPFAGFRLCISADAFTSLGQAQKVKERLKADQEKAALAKSRKDETTRLEQKLKQAEADAEKARAESEQLSQDAALAEKRKALELAEKKVSEEKAKLEAQKKQLALGSISARGSGKDEVDSVKWSQAAADQGDARGQYNLGVMYANGRGVGKDEAEAVKWYRKAADQGCAGGQVNLGDAYENGTGVGKDEAEAVKWYRKAADQGNEDALKALKRLEQTAIEAKRKSLELAEKKANEESPQSKQASIPLAFDSAGFLPKGGGLLIYKTQAFYANNLAEAMLFTKAIPRGPTTIQYIGLGGKMAMVPSDGELGIYTPKEIDLINLSPGSELEKYRAVMQELQELSKLNLNVANTLAPVLERMRSNIQMADSGKVMVRGEWKANPNATLPPLQRAIKQASLKLLTTTDGDTYKNVTYKSSDDQKVSFAHEDGGARVSWESLKRDDQLLWGYDAVKVKAEKLAQEKAAEEKRIAAELAQKKEAEEKAKVEKLDQEERARDEEAAQKNLAQNKANEEALAKLQNLTAEKIATQKKTEEEKARVDGER